MTPDDLTCSACRERLPWYVASCLSLAEGSAVERHLASCADCRREAAAWGAVATTLADEDNRIPPDTYAGDAWLTLRGQLPSRSSLTMSHSRKARVTEYDIESRAPASEQATTVPRPPRRPSHRPALALLAAVLLVTLSAALFGYFGVQIRNRHTPAVATMSTPTPSACASSALEATMPHGALIQDISMTSPRTGWAVGWIQTITQQGTVVPTATVLLQFQNCQWQPVDDSIAAAELWSVSMVSATDGWAVGTTANAKPLVLHYTDGQWQQVSLPEIANTTGIVTGMMVRMTSSGDGWMLINGGKSHINPYTAKYAYTLLHFQNGSWTLVPLTFDTSGALIFTDIAALTPDDCWVVGYGTGSGTSSDFAVAHYQNGVWTAWSGTQIGVQYPIIYSVSMTSPTDVWIAGAYPFTYSSPNYSYSGTAPLVLHYDGDEWTRENVANYLDPYTNGINIATIGALSSTEVWAFPDFPSNPKPTNDNYPMAHYSNGVWTWTTPLSTNIVAIDAVAFVSNSEGFAAAEMQSGVGLVVSIMLHYINGAWSVIPSR
ncbi:MAG: zf-HC2 domain-containing protein [Ktedonobacterales bacterium]